MPLVAAASRAWGIKDKLLHGNPEGIRGRHYLCASQSDLVKVQSFAMRIIASLFDFAEGKRECGCPISR